MPVTFDTEEFDSEGYKRLQAAELDDPLYFEDTEMYNGKSVGTSNGIDQEDYTLINGEYRRKKRNLFLSIEPGKPYQVWRNQFIEDRCCEKEDVTREVLVSSIPHILLNVLLVGYLTLGAFIFTILEPDMKEKEFIEIVLFAFVTTTTIGWGNISPVTREGRFFCLFFILLGTPLTYLVLGNNGQFIVDFYWIVKKSYFSKNENETIVGKDLPLPISVSLLLIHILVGAFIYSFWADDKRMIVSIYFCFISIATIGYGDETPATDNAMEYIVTFIYLGIGFILVTMLMGSMSQYLQKIHYWGRSLSGGEDVTVWFGGREMTVRDLITIVAEQFEVEPARLHTVLRDLDDILHAATKNDVENRTAAIQQTGEMIRSESCVVQLENGKKKSVIVHRHPSQSSDSSRTSPCKSFGVVQPLSHVDSDLEVQKTIQRDNENALHALRVINHTLQKQNSVRKMSKNRIPVPSPDMEVKKVIFLRGDGGARRKFVPSASPLIGDRSSKQNGATAV